MKKLILIFISITSLYSVDFDSVSLDNKTKLTYYYQDSSFSERSDGGSDLEKSFSRREVKNYTNINISDSIKIASTIGYYKNGSVYDKDKDLGEVWLSQDRSNIFIEKLYLQTKLAEIYDYKLSFAYGIIPLTGGNFKQFSNQDEVQGNGLFTLIDLNLQGGFFILSNEHNLFKIGQLYWKKDNWQHDEKLIDKNSGTNGTFIFYEHRHDKHTIELNFIDADVKYANYKMADAQLFGLGYSYNDSFDTGFVYYGILGYSIWKSHFEDVLNSGYFGAATNSIKYANSHYPDQYDFDNDINKGSSILLGTKYYTDFLGIDSSFGVEYFKTSKNFSSFSNGSLFYNDYGFWRRRGTDMYTIYADFKPFNNFTISLKYSLANNGYTAKNGAIADTTSLPAASNFYKKENNFLVKFSYEF